MCIFMRYFVYLINFIKCILKIKFSCFYLLTFTILLWSIKVDPIFYYIAFSSDTCPPPRSRLTGGWVGCYKDFWGAGGGGEKKWFQEFIKPWVPMEQCGSHLSSQLHGQNKWKQNKRRFLGIISQISSVVKSNHLHIDIFSVFKAQKLGRLCKFL